MTGIKEKTPKKNAFGMVIQCKMNRPFISPCGDGGGGGKYLFEDPYSTLNMPK